MCAENVGRLLGRCFQWFVFAKRVCICKNGWTMLLWFARQWMEQILQVAGIRLDRTIGAPSLDTTPAPPSSRLNRMVLAPPCLMEKILQVNIELGGTRVLKRSLFVIMPTHFPVCFFLPTCNTRSAHGLRNEMYVALHQTSLSTKMSYTFIVLTGLPGPWNSVYPPVLQFCTRYSGLRPKTPPPLFFLNEFDSCLR